MPSYAQAFNNEVSRAATEAWTRLMRGETELFLYYKRGGMRLAVIGWDEPHTDLELAMPERIPTDRTQQQIAMLFHDVARRLPILPTD